MQTTSAGISVLNSLLRGEIAATETYQQALAQVRDEPGTQDLWQLHDDHRQAANTLRRHIHYLGGQPDQDSGAWGAFAKAVEATAKVFGNDAALKALKEGEEYGVRQYERALAEEELPYECRSLVSAQLLPRTRAHVPVLDRLMNGFDSHPGV